MPYELAVIAKEKGFNEPCLAYYDNNERRDFYLVVKKESNVELLPTPLYQQILNWFIEKHDLEINVKSWKGEGDGKITWIYSVKALGVPSTYRFNTKSSSRLEAWQKAITAAFTLIK
ncbi:MAG: hypothetical protein AABY22_25145 [Nanoarchaeota archaeon]